ncbi:uncharacterized protein [Rutidosis leptorrhynchoides]|uniref:uncharacterized protein n=1 Tax=Rutidosis leptorrhynchoides TaxID=125765 RepID=UPI003A99B9ED
MERLNCVFHQSRASRFNRFIANNNLVEIPINGKRFTRISDDGTKFSKLDRFFVNDKFMRLWANLSVVPLDRRDSDHCPLLLRDRIIDFGPKPFKIFDEWFNKEGVDKVIIEAWGKGIESTRGDCVFRDKLKNVKRDLRMWSKKEFGNLDAEINELKQEATRLELLAESGCISDSDRVVWLDTRKRWVDKERIKMSMLKQKARIRWILEGNENSKYFHSTIRRKLNKSNIRGLNINGSWVEDPKVVKDTVFVHFKNIFSKKNITRPSLWTTDQNSMVGRNMQSGS